MSGDTVVTAVTLGHGGRRAPSSPRPAQRGRSARRAPFTTSIWTRCGQYRESAMRPDKYKPLRLIWTPPLGDAQWLKGTLRQHTCLRVPGFCKDRAPERDPLSGHGPTPVPLVGTGCRPDQGQRAGARRGGGGLQFSSGPQPPRRGRGVRNRPLLSDPRGGGGKLGLGQGSATHPPTHPTLGVGTRPRYLIVCLWRRLLASRHYSF